MEVRIVHFYPDLMDLYGSRANVLALERYLKGLGCDVTVEAVLPGAGADLSRGDFFYMGAGTERAARAAMEDFARFAGPLEAAARDCWARRSGRPTAALTTAWAWPPSRRSTASAASWGTSTPIRTSIPRRWWASSTSAASSPAWRRRC